MASGPGLTRGPWAELTLGALRPALCPVCVCVWCAPSSHSLNSLKSHTGAPAGPSSQGSPQDTREGLTHRHLCSQPHVARTDGVQVSQWGPSRCPRWPGSLTWCCGPTPRGGVDGPWGTPCRRRGFSGAVGGQVCGQVPDAARVDNQPCSRDTGGLGGQGWQWGGTPGAGEHSRPSSPACSLLRLGGSGYEGPSPAPRPSPGQVSHGRAGGGRGPGGPRSRAISLNQEGQ